MNPNKRRTQRSRTISVLLAYLMIFNCAEGRFTRLDASESDLQQSNPEPTFYLKWTATAKGFSDTTDSSGTRSVYSRQIVMTGSSIYRRHANGSHDNYPLDLTVTDDQDQVETYACAGGGVNRTHIFRHIQTRDVISLGPCLILPFTTRSVPTGAGTSWTHSWAFTTTVSFNYRTRSNPRTVMASPVRSPLWIRMASIIANWGFRQELLAQPRSKATARERFSPSTSSAHLLVDC